MKLGGFPKAQKQRNQGMTMRSCSRKDIGRAHWRINNAPFEEGHRQN